MQTVKPFVHPAAVATVATQTWLASFPGPFKEKGLVWNSVTCIFVCCYSYSTVPRIYGSNQTECWPES